MAPKFHQQFLCLALIILLSTEATESTSREIHDTSMTSRHDKWMIEYGRSYKDADEKEMRYRIYKDNVKYIDSFNKETNQPYKLGVNEFADLTNAEFVARHNKYTSFSKGKPKTGTSFSNKSSTAIPSSVDWRKKGAVTPIRDESCGGWAFAVVDAVEGLTKIKTGTLYTLSVQEIVDCSAEKSGCEGGFTDEAYDFIETHGLTTKANYPSKGDNGTCNTEKEAQPVAKITGYKNVRFESEVALAQAVANQPVVVMVDASGPNFQFYSSGIFTGKCGTTLDHGVTAIGYGFGSGNSGEVKYWVVKNSWGTSWGEEGYMRMQRDIAAKEGLCGIAMEASYPIA